MPTQAISGYMSHSDLVTLGASTTLKGMITNPNASGKRIIIQRMDILSSLATAVTIELFTNPTTNNPTTSKTISPNVIDSAQTLPSSVATFASDAASTSPSGGTSMIKFPIIPSGITQITPPGSMVLYPNNKLAYAVTGIATANAMVVVFWREENI